jgi:hypothetical protein
MYGPLLRYYNPKHLTPLDKLLIKKGFVDQNLTYFKGNFYKGVLCYDPITDREEYHDINDVTTPIDKLTKESIINIKNDGLEKTTTLKKVVNGVFYKWQTSSGLYFVLTHLELETLSRKEKRLLRMI